MTTETPTFWLSPDCDETGLFVCPKCNTAHRHSLPEDDGPSHRAAHCADKSHYPNGYYIQREDM